MNQLGMNPSPFTARLQFSRYLETSKLPSAPISVNWTKVVGNNFAMLGNDTVGDCVPAGQLHMAQCWIANASGKVVLPTTADAIQLYNREAAYNPNNPATDLGCDPLTALNFWRIIGVPIGGARHKIEAFAQVNLSNAHELQSALWLFGGLFTGWMLPASAQGQSVWSVPASGPVGPGAPGSWGGHLAPLAVDEFGRYGVISWGGIIPVTPGFVTAYAAPGEIWAVISSEWIEKNGKTPTGLNLAQLKADLSVL